MFLPFLLNVTSGFEQVCYLDNATNREEIPEHQYYSCGIFSINLTDHENDVITTMTNHTELKTDADVQMVYYDKKSIVTFIPNSLFIQFKNLEFVSIEEQQFFNKMKREYLINATNLKFFFIPLNSITELDASVFAEAPNLEQINLAGNLIKRIHALAFSGLKGLVVLYLQDNKLTHLNPYTFSNLASKPHIDLFNNLCIQERFFGNTTELIYFRSIETSILKSQCNYSENFDYLKYSENEVNQTKERDDVANLKEEIKEQLEKKKNEIIKNMEKIRESIMLLEQNIKNLSKDNDYTLNALKNELKPEFFNLKAKFTKKIDALNLTYATTQQIKVLTETFKNESDSYNSSIVKLHENRVQLRSDIEHYKIILLAVLGVFATIFIVQTIFIIMHIYGKKNKMTQQENINRELQEKFKLKKNSQSPLDTDSVELSILMANF